MNKWYEKNTNSSAVLSARVRVARNFADDIFPLYAKDNQRLEIIDKAARALSRYNSEDSLSMSRIDMLDAGSKYSLIDKHLISPMLAKEKSPSAAFISLSENLSIMLLEEDHIRIQAIEAGDAIGEAYERAMGIDDIIDDAEEYAYDEALGYLTSCPTNAGTGLRASFMLHIPYLEANGQISNIARSISKFGYTLRGTFGEGSEAYGSVYQISNQVTLGLTEEEIISNIDKLKHEIVEKELTLMNKDIERNKLAVEDRIYRTLGILTNARYISEKEAINSLSIIKMGIMGGIIKEELPNIYDVIINIRAATLSKKFEIDDINFIPVKRAEYLRKALKA